jgi:hypothetical protein
MVSVPMGAATRYRRIGREIMLTGRVFPACLLFMVFNGLLDGSSGEIMRDEARRLVTKVVEAQGTPTKSPKSDLEDNTAAAQDFPDFYFFDAYFDTPNRLATIGSYAVNRKTADVWEWIGCHRLGPKPIKSYQGSLRRQIGLSRSQYRKLSRHAPCQNQERAAQSGQPRSGTL